ncbi:MAG: carboxypeptidase-like regulatory domain-containing protein [Chitinophagales bacterium]|nr:carboxypeptidase-like regulatory domain-containing protein [Chitinophagales bacterium]
MKFFYATLFVVLSCFLFAQKGDLRKELRHSQYTYIYKVPAAHAAQFLKRSIKQPEHILSYLCVDSFNTDSSYQKTLPAGHYLFVKATGKMLDVQYKHVTNLWVNALPDVKRVKFLVHDFNQVPVINAEVKLGLRKTTYNTLDQAYLLPYHGKKRWLNIAVPGDTTFFWLNKKEDDYYSKPTALDILRRAFVYPFQRLKYKLTHLANKRSEYDGYIVFNKPKYMPGDTVKFKAYITQHNGKPYTENAMVKVGERWYGKEKILMNELKPVSDGAYFSEFVLNDSFQIDKTYQLKLFNSKERLLIEGYFKTEQYLLDANSYTAAADKENYYPSDSIQITINATDFNGLPVMDGTARLVAKTYRIEKYYSKQVYTPDTLFKAEKRLDNSGKTNWSFSTTHFPKADLQIQFKVSCVNSNNELWDTTFTVNYKYSKREVKVVQKNDSIVANYWVNGKETLATGRLCIAGNCKVISYPYAQKTNPLHSIYEFYAQNDSVTYDFSPNYADAMSCMVLRTDTTASFIVINPERIGFHYQIFKGGKSIEQGIADTLRRHFVDATDAAYVLVVKYIWRGNAERKVWQADKNKSQLIIETVHDGEVFPGQLDTITIKVTKHDNQPAPSVNLTAWAINAQFAKDITTPELPNYYHPKKFNKLFVQSQLAKPDFSAKFILHKFLNWRYRLQLQQLPYYQMVYPAASATIYLDSTSFASPQYAPYIYQNGKQVKIYGITIDGRLVYSWLNQLSAPYSFVLSPGFHRVQIRTQKHLFLLDSVMAPIGKKMEVSYRYDSLLAQQSFISCKKQLSTSEVNVQRNALLVLDAKKMYWYDLWLSQGNRVFHKKSSDNNYETALVGPFGYDSITVFKENHYSNSKPFEFSFVPERGYAYSFESNKQRLVEHQLFEKKVKLKELYNVSDMLFGEIALPAPHLPPAQKPKQKYFLDNSVSSTTSRTGKLEVRIVTDSTFAYLHLLKLDTCNYSKLLSGTWRTFHALDSGRYILRYYTESGSYFETPPVTVLPFGTNFYEWKPDSLSQKLDLKALLGSKRTDSSAIGGVYHQPQIFTGDASLTGLVTDEAGEPVAFASVVLRKNNEVIKGGTTDFDGRYSIAQVPDGVYELRVSFVGYKNIERKVVLKNDQLLEQNVTLIPSQNELKEVMIVTDRYMAPLKEQSVSLATYAVSGVSIKGARMANGNVRFAPSELESVASYGYSDVRKPSKGTYTYSLNPTTLEEGEEDKQYRMVTDSSGNTYAWLGADGKKKFEEDKYKGAKSLRNAFSDYAYWQPNLITDATGKASFAVQYPDNLTAWQAYILAMDGKKHSGQSSLYVRSYKDMSASLSVPQFLIEGDSGSIVCRINNYTADTLTPTASYKLNGELLMSNAVKVKGALSEIIAIKAPLLLSETDTLKPQFGISLPGGFADAEERSIPVLKQGTEEADGVFMVLRADTSFTFTPSGGKGNVTLHAESDVLQLMLRDLEQLKNYPHWCTEQTASKLIGLCLQQRIDSLLGKKSVLVKEKAKLLKKLQSMQLFSGGFGWWENAPFNAYLTNHALKAMYMAGEKESSSYALRTAKKMIQDNLQSLSVGEKLAALQTISVYTNEKEWVAFHLRQFQFDSLSTIDQLQLVHTQLLCGIDSAAYQQKVLSKQKTTAFGGVYFGDDTYSFTTNSAAATVCAYKIAELLGNQSLQDATLSYLITTRNHSGWRNTFETAEILSAVLPQVIKTRGGKMTSPKLNINGDAVVAFPYTKKYEPNQELRISKTGDGLLFFTAYQKWWNTKPQQKADVYEIQTSLAQNGNPLTNLKAGEPAELKVKITAKNFAEYISIEVPIPAGCTYYKKDFPKMQGEIHREYHKNKVMIFCDKLNAGTHEYRIWIEPRFSGGYTLNPARCELMYFPTIYGRNEIKKINIAP